MFSVSVIVYKVTAATLCSFYIKCSMCPSAAGRRIQAVINEMLRQFAPLNDISQGSVATHYRCGGIYSDGIIANLFLILAVRQFQISVDI